MITEPLRYGLERVAALTAEQNVQDESGLEGLESRSLLMSVSPKTLRVWVSTRPIKLAGGGGSAVVALLKWCHSSLNNG